VTALPRWQVGDRDHRRIKVGTRVFVIDRWNPAACDKGVGQVVELMTSPHHAIRIRFSDGSTDWILSGLTVVADEAPPSPAGA
jgi:hypothetical protein